MYQFPEGLYTDVRIEEVFQSDIQFTMGELEEFLQRKYESSFIRVYDGNRWFYSAITGTEEIQNEINELAKLARKNSNINEEPIVQKIETHKGNFRKFENNDLSEVDHLKKMELLKQYFPTLKNNEYVNFWSAHYLDLRKIKKMYNSKGSDFTFDTQHCGFSLGFNLSNEDTKFFESFRQAHNCFSDLSFEPEELSNYLKRCENFLIESKPVEAGIYPVVLSPMAAGVFAHESFGHKSEADFMLGDETMKREWAIGTPVGSDILSIVDDGNQPGTGYTPFDDEGTASTPTHLIKNGILSGRLHSSITAASLEESVTGNARAMSYQFEPIVRMTTTFIEPGNLSLDELFGGVEDGFFIETIKHGSGMSTFTIAPSLAYRIRNGKITEPVNISVISGTVFDTLGEIDGLSDKLELLSFVGGGCGKMEQFPLPVGFGGPHVRVRQMQVQ